MVFNRRKFLCGATAATIYGPAFMRAVRVDAAASATKTILITIQFDGGNDAFNTVVPIGSAAYGAYNDIRANIAIADSDINTAGTAFDANVSTPSSSATTYAFHPIMKEMRSLYGAGKVALLMGVGLPANADAREGHEEAKFAWSVGGINNFDQVNTGWLGAAFDQFSAASGLPPLISVTGQTPLDMHGKTVPALTIGGDITYFSPNTGSGGNDATLRLSSLGSNDGYASAFAPAEFARSVAVATSGYVAGIQSIAKAEPLSDYVTTYAFTPGSTPSYSGLKVQLQQIARLILGNAPTRAYWAVQGGHDSHSAQATNQPPLLGEFSQAVSEFLTYLTAKSSAVAANVVIQTVTDFGRRANSNSTDGTDHGTAGVNFVIGNGVKGGVYGAYPSLSNLDSNGDTLIQVDFRQQLTESIAALGADPVAVLGGTYQKLGYLE